jgi:hypothetical protein
MDALEFESLDLDHLQWASRKITGHCRLGTGLQSLGYYQALLESCKVSLEGCMPLLCRVISIYFESGLRLLTRDEPSHLETQAPFPL